MIMKNMKRRKVGLMDMYLISIYSDSPTPPPPLKKKFPFVDDYEDHEDFVNHWNGFRCQIF